LIDRAIVLAKQIDEARIHDEIEAATAAAPAAPVVRSVMNEAEVREMAASGLVRFGSHTRTHYRFRAPAPRSVLENEIGVSGEEVASISGMPAALFCYPNGDTTDEAVDEVRRHYLAAVTTQKGWHDPRSDLFRMRRVGVHEDVSATRAAFLSRLSGWV
jgi:peptidoglycan/xylan/chitin deacetylase (PgdA/CDA1 family)